MINAKTFRKYCSISAAGTMVLALTIIATDWLSAECLADETSDSVWSAKSPRDEIRPEFSYSSSGGHRETGTLIITHDARKGLDGWYERSFEVQGDSSYHFQAYRKLEGVTDARRSALVRIRWQDELGKMVSATIPEHQRKDLGHVPTAEPEHPVDGQTDADGWTRVEGHYQAPMRAVRAVVELHLQWAPNGRVEWSDVKFEKVEQRPPRLVRLASIHHRPSGKSAHGNCKEFVPFIKQAAEQRADLVVMGETIPSVNIKLSPAEVAEPIPGPSTDFFGELAKQYSLHLVFSLYERDEHLVYNTGVLIGPDGNLIGKYRKVCLPHGEVEKGVAPGDSYPVFDTAIGKVGIMVCYDGFFPEVARELSNRGAEVIAWPVWGCNPLLAQARACENHIYLVSSTFMAPEDGWMLSAVFDQTGKAISKAEQWDSVVIAEVDLNRPYIGPWNLGDFHSMMPRHRPLLPSEQTPVRDN